MKKTKRRLEARCEICKAPMLDLDFVATQSEYLDFKGYLLDCGFCCPFCRLEAMEQLDRQHAQDKAQTKSNNKKEKKQCKKN